ncbi:hypothetical protein NUSPORA_01532 [Nucleospora cyclopteri]
MPKKDSKELETWLQVANENKITIKNTWNAPLISHFADLATFQEDNGINFKKASRTLDGCVKVYSTRVDDVSDNALKLIDIFGKENDDEKNKLNKKKKNDFIEKNLNNINLKVKSPDIFYDSIFQSIFSKNKDFFLIDEVRKSKSGLFLFNKKELETEIILEDEKAELEIEKMPICADLHEIRDLDDLIEIENPTAPKIVTTQLDETLMNATDFEFDAVEEAQEEELEEFSDQLDQEREIVEQKQADVFLKGWAGPKHWKTEKPAKRNVKNALKTEKKKYFINFMEEINTNIIFEKNDNTMSKEAILERRKKKNVLPEDFAYETDDLYKFMIVDNSFKSIKNSEKSIKEESTDNMNIIENFEEENSFVRENSFVGENQPLEMESLEDIKEEPLSVIKFSRIAKKVDMMKLKENIYKNLDKETKLSQIMKKVQLEYPRKEAKDISIHFFLIGLLHLANEKGLQLEGIDNEILIKYINK